MENLDLKKEAQTQPPEVKKAYHSPEFVEYGQVAKLTQSTTGPVSDGMAALLMPCL